MTHPTDDTRCVALVLGAGQGRRFGSDKRQARLSDGRSVLQATLDGVQAHFASLCVVLRPDDDVQVLGIASQLRVVRATRAAQGMGASLAAGIRALVPTDARAVAVLLGDMPWIAPATLSRLTCLAHEDAIVVPCHQGQRGHPVIFGRRFWPALAQLEGDQGGRAVIDAHPQACLMIEVPDDGILRDIDTPADLR
ncbi:nucleotidyltransferase family protein [Pseudomonas sp. S75]|uniref:nucleotidyltransferase family protein n=1 Tax=unclassified Pseudomonas TaxID=196821 RepID=UPI0019087BE6|nr:MULTISPECIES: nucleotidyltransferase family protein [unclassified Pseudomonas]MBJ9973990.1 nucleotidyltransferase family protein [Pseudomonas sp. S30]MBK0152080.1 nucleotidyltransferase family protein [Pseudomonas sp. S75]